MSLLPNAEQQFLDGNGVPLAGGFVYTYLPGTTTPVTTWTDYLSTTVNTNPIVLDSGGRATIWAAGPVRQVVTDLNGNLIWDQVTSGSTPAVNVPTIAALRGTSTAGLAVYPSNYCAILLGYNKVGDKSPVLYEFIAGAPPAGGDNGGSVIVAADGGGYWFLPPEGNSYYNLVDFGCGLGAPDDTTQFAAALATGYNVVVPAATVNVNSFTATNTLGKQVCLLVTTQGQRIIGTNRGSSIISTTQSTGILIQLAADDAAVEELTFMGSSDGWMIHCQSNTAAKTPRCIIRNIYFKSCPGLIAVGELAGWVQVDNIYAAGVAGGTVGIADGTTNSAIAAFYGWGTTGNAGPWFLTDVLVGGAAQRPFIGIYLNGACNSSVFSNLYFNNIDTLLIQNNNIGAPGGVPNFNKYHNIAIQNPANTLGLGYAIQLVNGNHTTFDGFLFISTNNTPVGGGVYIGPNVKYAYFGGNLDVDTMATDGFTIQGSYVELLGGQVFSNNMGNGTGYNIDIGAQANNVIVNNIFRMGSPTGPPNVTADIFVSPTATNVFLGNINYGASTPLIDNGYVSSQTPIAQMLQFNPFYEFASPGNSSWTYSTQTGYAALSGEQVTFQIHLVGSVNNYTTASGALSIGGLPYQSRPDGLGTGSISIGAFGQFTITAGQLTAVVNVSSSTIALFESVTATNKTSLSTTNVPPGTSNVEIYLTGTYLAAGTV